MTSEDLLKRTSQYQIHYSSPPARNLHGSAATTGHNHPTSLPNRTFYYPRARHTQPSTVDSPRFAQRSSDQNLRHSAHASDHNPASTITGRDYYASLRSFHRAVLSSSPRDESDELLDVETGINTFTNNRVQTNPGSFSAPTFTITTDCDDRSGDEEEESSAATLADRHQRNHLSGSYSSADEDFSMSRLIGRHSRAGGRERHSRKRTTPSRIEPSTSPAVPKDGDGGG